MDYLVHHMLRDSAKQRPEQEALVFGDNRVCYGETWQRTEALATAFRDAGIERNDRVGIFLDPGIDLAITIFAISRCGGVFVPIHHGLFRDQVAHIVRDCGMKAVVTSVQKLPHLDRTIEDANALEFLALADEAVELPIRTISINDAASQTNDESLPDDAIENDLAAILYTSGSTGRPKGVMLSHKNLVTGASIVSDYLGITEQDRILAALPFSFDAGLNQLTTAIQQGGTLVMLKFVLGRQIVDVLLKERITGLAGVPALWSLLAQPSSTLKSRTPALRYITNTGGHMHRSLLDALRKALPQTNVFLMYGLTEAFRSTYLPPTELDHRPDSMGKAIPNTEIMVVNAAGDRCQPGEVGELVHHGPTVSLGYWGQPELTSQVLRPHPFPLAGVGPVDRVCYSGDLVREDEQGFLYFVARADNMIKTSGFRVSPSEVEEVVCQHPNVRHAAVIGIADEILGQKIAAFVVPNEACGVDEDSLMAFCAEQMPRHMVPRSVKLLEDLPKTSSGKVNYPALRDRD